MGLIVAVALYFNPNMYLVNFEFLLGVCTAGMDILRWDAKVVTDYGYWTLGIEEKAYILLAFLFVFLQSKKQVFQFFIVWIVLSYFSHVLLFEKLQNVSDILYCSPFLGISQIFMGCVAYFFYKNVDPVSFLSKRQSIVLLTILLFLSFAVFHIYDGSIYIHVLSLLFSPIIVYLSSRPSGLFPKSILQTLLLKIGERSYIIYLIHFPLLHAAFWVNSHPMIYKTMAPLGNMLLITEVMILAFFGAKRKSW